MLEMMSDPGGRVDVEGSGRVPEDAAADGRTSCRITVSLDCERTIVK